MAWKIEEVEFLKESCRDIPVKDIAKTLGKSNKSVREKMRRLELRVADLKRTEIFDWTDEQIQFLVDNYKTMQDKEIGLALFDDGGGKVTQRIFRKRHSLNLQKDERGLKYNKDVKGDYLRRRYNGETIYEHIENAEKKLGRKIEYGEVVHHIDSDKRNNGLDNLYICKDKSEHKSLHVSMEKLAFEFYKMGHIKFDENTGEYHINKDMLT